MWSDWGRVCLGTFLRPFSAPPPSVCLFLFLCLFVDVTPLRRNTARRLWTRTGPGQVSPSAQRAHAVRYLCSWTRETVRSETNSSIIIHLLQLSIQSSEASEAARAQGPFPRSERILSRSQSSQHERPAPACPPEALAAGAGEQRQIPRSAVAQRGPPPLPDPLETRHAPHARVRRGEHHLQGQVNPSHLTSNLWYSICCDHVSNFNFFFFTENSNAHSFSYLGEDLVSLHNAFPNPNHQKWMLNPNPQPKYKLIVTLSLIQHGDTFCPHR